MLSKTIKITIVLLSLFALAVPSSVGIAAGEIPPFANAPECPDANSDGHADVTDNKNYGKSPDKELFHDLWNEVKGCHYSHEHGDDPDAPAIAAIFGPAGDMWNGATESSIGVPFATSALENSMKHSLSIYYTMTAAQLDAAGFPCGVGNNTDNGGNGTAHCVRAWRILAHGAGNLMEALVNNHSVFAEVQVCNKNDLSQCGIFRSGGWLFYGKFQSPFYNQTFARSGGTFDIGGMTMTFPSDTSDLAALNSPNTVFDDWGGEPYWFMTPRWNGTFDVLTYTRTYDNSAGDQFSSNEIGPSSLSDCAPFPVGSQCGNRLFHVAIRVFDGWNLADTTNINNPIFICTQISPANCTYNSSMRGMNEVQTYVDSAWDGASFDTDSRAGYVSMNQYTDRYQRLRLAGTCSAIGVDCVPLMLDKMPVGYSSVHTGPGNIKPGIDREYDTYFNGKTSGWIQFSEHASHAPVPTNTPPSPPSSTPPPAPSSTPTSPSSSPFVSTDVNPASLNIGGTSVVSVNLNNVPADGYKSAEFTCTYNAGLVEKSNIIATNLFGVEPVVAVHDPQGGTFIVAMAGTNSNRATTSGTAFTFSAKGLQAGQSQVQCMVRVSKGDNVPMDLPSTGASLTILGAEPSPTPFVAPTSTPDDHQHPVATNTPFEALTATPVPTLSPNGALSGQVIASKPVTISLFDANNVVITSLTANLDGTFSLSPLAGNYTLVATASGFLSHQGSVTVAAGNAIVLPAINLLAGDVDGNNVIDQFDALTIGMSYASSSPASADLNSDGSIDFLDLELLAENYRKTGPTAW